MRNLSRLEELGVINRQQGQQRQDLGAVLSVDRGFLILVIAVVPLYWISSSPEVD